MNSLPSHGRINCNKCYTSNPTFDRTYQQADGWRIKANPLAWGSENPAIIVLGFSKGQTQSGALENIPHDGIAFKGNRSNVGKILRRIGLLKAKDNQLSEEVDYLISDRKGLFHFGSLIRCSVERNDTKKGWTGTGGGMLDKFVQTNFGGEIAQRCASTFLGNTPPSVKLVVMFGMGSGGNYIKTAKHLIESARGTEMLWLNDVTYYDNDIVIVHVEHFAAQGNLIPKWLGDGEHKGCERSQLSEQALKGVMYALSRTA